ncbi:MAG: chorismate synthase [Synergistaceae bacterium]|jgi:chorismate synthase|nr:chorismate synthase [Synergistaceae bacterium]
MNTWGNGIRLSIFGESHGRAVGIVIDGLPAGEPVEMDKVSSEMKRRAPGRDEFSTARREADEVEILSGIINGRTTGAPLCGIIFNAGARSGDYGALPRPGHADWTALLKFGGFADMRGGGHFSGRLTAPLTFAGSVAKQILSRRDVEIYARIIGIGDVTDDSASITPEEYRVVSASEFPALQPVVPAMKEAIRSAREDGDSVGGTVEVVAFGLSGGLGEPFFGSMESSISSLIFSVPAVKGIEFGDGFRLASMRGSEANDALYAENGRILARTNHNGGILGGITNGMPLVARVVIKPTPSIALPQESVDPSDMTGRTIRIAGRHDPCIVKRAVPVLEACLAICSLDAVVADARSRG